MSIDIDWNALTEGPHGEALAESIRGFIHERFQNIPLPRLIRSVKVVAFEFGSVAPEIELKDVCNPLPDFYDDEDDDDDNGTSPQNSSPLNNNSTAASPNIQRLRSQGGSLANASGFPRSQSHPDLSGGVGTLRHDSESRQSVPPHEIANPLFARAQTPGIPGGTSNMNYFHLPLTNTRFSGTSTPLAAFSGAGLTHGLPTHPGLFHQDSYGFPSGRGGSSSPVHPLSRDPPRQTLPAVEEEEQEGNPTDVQVVFHLKYSGDVKLSLAAEILLDFPMPSFVGLPVNLKVTGLTFDGVAILAYIKHKAHFCFLGPEDGNALLDGGDVPQSPDEEQRRPSQDDDRNTAGTLFEEIRVESEIGERTDSKQVLKNVGTVEKFILEQVTKIFETELVYPSFWTFLV